MGNIANNATVVFDQGSNATFGGSISGNGSFIKTGSGILTFGAANSYSGGTLISEGGIIGDTGSLKGVIVNNGSLTFDQSADGLFNGILGGTGTMTKLGTGNLTFNSNSALSGLLTVGQGTLTLANVGLPGSVSVGTQATLAGIGTIGGNLTLGGQLQLPGISQAAAAAAGVSGFNSVKSAVIMPFATRDLPSLVVNGDLIANQGSTMDFTVSSAGAAPILVNGHASLIGTHMNVTIDDPNPSRNATYTASTALNGLSFAGTNATTTSTSILPLLTQGQNSLLLTILSLKVPVTATATTKNGIAAGRGIDAVKQCTSNTDLCNVVKEVLALDQGSLDNALRELPGEIHATPTRLLVNDSRGTTGIVRSAGSDAEHAVEAAPGGVKTGRPTLRPWLQFSADHGSFKSTQFSNATGNVGGGGGGVGFRPTGLMTLGGGGSFSLGSLSLTELPGKSDLKSPRAFGYTGFKFGPFHLNGGSSVSKNNTSTNRSVNIHAKVPDENGNLVPLSN